jgi:hypothetical protein
LFTFDQIHASLIIDEQKGYLWCCGCFVDDEAASINTIKKNVLTN